METKFYVGQKCKSIQLGDCEVVEISHVAAYPITCKNTDGTLHSFTANGRNRSTDIAPSLYPAEYFPFELFKERMMEVSNNKVDWEERKVIGVFKGFFIAENKFDAANYPVSYKFAREIASEPSQDEIRQQIIDLGNQMSELFKKIEVMNAKEKAEELMLAFYKAHSGSYSSVTASISKRCAILHQELLIKTLNDDIRDIDVRGNILLDLIEEQEEVLTELKKIK